MAWSLSRRRHIQVWHKHIQSTNFKSESNQVEETVWVEMAEMMCLREIYRKVFMTLNTKKKKKERQKILFSVSAT